MICLWYLQYVYGIYSMFCLPINSREGYKDILVMREEQEEQDPAYLNKGPKDTKDVKDIKDNSKMNVFVR